MGDQVLGLMLALKNFKLAKTPGEMHCLMQPRLTNRYLRTRKEALGLGPASPYFHNDTAGVEAYIYDLFIECGKDIDATAARLDELLDPEVEMTEAEFFRAKLEEKRAADAAATAKKAQLKAQFSELKRQAAQPPGEGGCETGGDGAC